MKRGKTALVVLLVGVVLVVGGQQRQRGRLRQDQSSTSTTFPPAFDSSSYQQQHHRRIISNHHLVRNRNKPVVSSTSASEATEGPQGRLGRPNRKSTTPLPPVEVFREPENNNVQDKKDIIAKLCQRKYGLEQPPSSSVPLSPPSVSVIDNGVDQSSSSASPQPSRRGGSHRRIPRQAKRLPRPGAGLRTSTTTTTTTPFAPMPPDNHVSIPSTTATTPEVEVLCNDFDHLSYEQLGHRLKNWRKKKKKDPTSVLT